MSRDPVLVVGAGGFIGSAVLARLRASGMPVRAGMRGGGVDAVACDLDAPESLAAAVAGAGAVVNAAGRVAGSMARETRALIAAAEAAGLRRIVHLSSVAVYGEAEGKVDEDTAPGGPPDPYGAAKRESEALLRAWASRPGRGRSVVMLRPGPVYGRGGALWVERPVAALRAGVLGDLGEAGEGIANLVHVADVAEAVRLSLVALEADDPGFSALALNIVGAERPSWNAYFRALGQRFGTGPLRRIGPGRMALLRGLAMPAKVARRLGLPAPAGLVLVPAPGELRLFRRRAAYDATRAAEAIGWCPATPLDQGLASSLPEATA